jgi:hypothetical protein
LIRYWDNKSKEISVKDINILPKKLKRRYRSLISRTLIFFSCLTTISIALSLFLRPNPLDNLLTLGGCLGYLTFAIGLLNSIILLSLDRLPLVLKSIIPATIINFIIAYLCGNLFGVYFCAIGPIVGGAFFAIASGKRLLQVFTQPDYCYFYSGY